MNMIDKIGARYIPSLCVYCTHIGELPKEFNYTVWRLNALRKFIYDNNGVPDQMKDWKVVEREEHNRGNTPAIQLMSAEFDGLVVYLDECREGNLNDENGFYYFRDSRTTIFDVFHEHKGGADYPFSNFQFPDYDNFTSSVVYYAVIDNKTNKAVAIIEETDINSIMVGVYESLVDDNDYVKGDSGLITATFKRYYSTIKLESFNEILKYL